MADYHVGCGIAGIYAGTLNKKGNMWVNKSEIGCLTCAEEHRQLAEWLKDYKRLLEQEPKPGHWIVKQGREQGYDIAGIKT